MSDSGQTSPDPQPGAAAPPPAPPVPPLPPAPPAPPAAPPYAAASALPPSSAAPGAGEGYPLPPEYTAAQTRPYPPGYPAGTDAAYAPPATAPQPADNRPPAYAQTPPFTRQPQGYVPNQPYGYAAPQGYPVPAQGYGPYAAPPPVAKAPGAPGLGIMALAFAVLAAIGATIVGSIAAYNIGLGMTQQFASDPANIDFDWSILTPVRDWVLIGEVAFWGGTVLGIWALVQGIVAIVKPRGRGWGIAAVVIAVLGPVVFATGVQAFLAAGFAAGAATLGG